MLDRDGTLIVDRHYLADPARVELVPESVDAMRLARDRGWAVGVLTNQGGIALRRFGWSAAVAVQAALDRLLAKQELSLDVALLSPFHPDGTHGEFGRDAQPSDGRKPAPGMVELAMTLLGIDRGGNVLMVGDKTTDLAAAVAAGVEGMCVPRSDGKDTPVRAEGWAPVLQRIGRSG